ncbi:ANTAR domain-containing protein [Streptomyces bacillaris]|uniref:ANTAR domain-containing protein n=1 Tax=Streptomyces bacillaris TaxID=68179 RepID=UPI000FDBE8BF|nr:ANTAR domain-containing protein [Streptomyces sp. HNA39]
MIDQACEILMKLSRRSPGRKRLVRLSQNTNINARVVAEAILAYTQGRAARRRAPLGRRYPVEDRPPGWARWPGPDSRRPRGPQQHHPPGLAMVDHPELGLIP